MEKGEPVSQLCSRNAPLHWCPQVGRAICHIFQVSVTSPKQVRAQGHGEQGEPQGCPTLANSQGSVGQNAPENRPENARRIRFGGHTSEGPPPPSLAQHREGWHPNTVRKPSARQTVLRPTNPASWPAGVPFLALSHGAGPTSKPVLKPSPASPAFCFQGPVPPGLHIGNPVSRRHASPYHTSVNGAFQHFGQPSERDNLPAHNEVSPIFGCPISPKRQRRTPGRHLSFKFALGTLPCTRALGWATSFPWFFRAAAPCNGRERALGH